MLKDRVIKRLDALGINAFEAARRGGFERTFVNEIVRGRKRMLQPRNLPRLAKVLECSVAYLNGSATEPGEFNPSERLPQPTPQSPHDLGSGLDFLGMIEQGTLRDVDYMTDGAFSAVVPIGRDARYPLAEQGVYTVNDRCLQDVNILPGMMVVAVSCSDYTRHYGPLTIGMLVVVERVVTALDKVETMALEIGRSDADGTFDLIPRTKHPRAQRVKHPTADEGVDQKITGIIKRAIQVF